MKMTWSGALLGRGGRRLAGGSARRRRVMVVVAAGAAVMCAGLLTGAGSATAGAGARAAAAGVRWGRAEGVPGLVAANVRGNATVTTLSCWSVNNCAAGGHTVYGGREQVFLVTERNGRWDRAEKVPGLAKLNNSDGGAGVVSVSCAPGGYCAGGGYYADGSNHSHAFVASGRKGRWRAAVAWPGAPVLNGADGPDEGDIVAVSCPSAGSCAAAGNVTLFSGPLFVVSQKNGVWGTPRRLPGIPVANGLTAVASLSCPSAGNCGARGTAALRTGSFVASERNGRWTKAENVPGMTTLTKRSARSAVNAVSCPSAGHCTAAGTDAFHPSYYHAFVTGP